MATVEKCDAWLAKGSMGLVADTDCERDAGHENQEGAAAHYGGGAYWLDRAEHARRGPKPTDSELVSLRKVITDTADHVAERDQVHVVLDDVVAEEIARAVAERYGIAT